MRTLDTNVVVRLLIGDDPQQTPIAERAFLEVIATGGVYLDRQSRYELLERLVRTRGVVVDDIDAVIDALEQFRQGGDLADQLILARAARIGASPRPWVGPERSPFRSWWLPRRRAAHAPWDQEPTGCCFRS